MNEYTLTNTDIIRQHIHKKQNVSVPYYIQVSPYTIPTTDMDHFPYQRFFRGKFERSDPTIFGREAGYYPRNDECYRKQVPINPEKVEYCWQYPCSNIKPCQSTTKGTYIITP